MPRAFTSGVVLAALLALTLGMLAGKAAAAAESGEIQAVLNPDGTGAMNANSQTNPPGETWSWQACASDLSSCAEPFATGRSATTAGAPAPAVFKATSSEGAEGLSPVWRGDPVSVTPPSVAGEIRANELVTPVLGEWSGGWEGDQHQTQLAACADAEGTDCTTLTATNYIRACAGGAAVIDPEFAGDHLRVADRDLGASPVFPLVPAFSPYGRGVWEPTPTTSVAMVGQIAPAIGARTERCGPPPLPGRALLSIDGIATVDCPLGCHVGVELPRWARSADAGVAVAARALAPE